MLSRVAESIYWMNRYVERAENVARFVDVNLLLHLELPGTDEEQWSPLVAVTGDYESFTSRYGAATRKNVIEFLAFDRSNPNSVISCLHLARENARSIREVTPTDLWEQLNTFYHFVAEAASAPEEVIRSPHDFLERIKRESHLFAGITMVTVPHNEVWHFCRMGQLIERADKTSRILDVKYFLLLPSIEDVGTPLDTLHWTALLKSASAYESYRQRHGHIQPDNVVEYLVLDREFPRACHYCVSRVEDSLHAVSGSPEGSFCNAAEQRCGRLRSELAFANMSDIHARGLHEFLDSFQGHLNRVGDAIHDTFFGMRPVVQILGPMAWEGAQ